MKHSKTPPQAPPAAKSPLLHHPIALFLLISTVTFVSFIAGTRIREWQTVLDPLLGINRSVDSLDLASIQNTFKYLDANYDGKLDKQALIDGANRGLVEAAGDQYTVYMNQKEAEMFQKELSGDIGAGIGAEIGQRNDQPTVLRVLNDNPAEQAGIKAGDTILKINDETVGGLSTTEVVQKIRGEEGSSVKLTIVRGSDTKEYTLTRAKITNPSVRSEVKNGVGVLTISRFDQETGSLARQAADGFVKDGVKKVIVDIRGDGGGYLDAAVDVAGLWLEDKVVVVQKSKGKVTNRETTGSNAPLANMETVVLVNGGTASASEILAAALRDYGKARLVGEKTFGKGSVQQVIELRQRDALLKVTVARWYTPKDKNIDKNGLVPDSEVKLSDEDNNAGRDPQYDRAIQLLR